MKDKQSYHFSIKEPGKAWDEIESKALKLNHKQAHEFAVNLAKFTGKEVRYQPEKGSGVYIQP